MFPELLKRFKSPNPKVATFCMSVVMEAVRSKDYTLEKDVNLKALFKAIQPGLTH